MYRFSRKQQPVPKVNITAFVVIIILVFFQLICWYINYFQTIRYDYSKMEFWTAGVILSPFTRRLNKIVFQFFVSSTCCCNITSINSVDRKLSLSIPLHHHYEPVWNEESGFYSVLRSPCKFFTWTPNSASGRKLCSILDTRLYYLLNSGSPLNLSSFLVTTSNLNHYYRFHYSSAHRHLSMYVSWFE